jgi:hypothetical protein
MIPEQSISLYEILFGEAAPTPEEALASDAALYITSNPTFPAYILFHKKRVAEVIRKLVDKTVNESEVVPLIVKNNGILGNVNIARRNNYIRVQSSVGIDKYGPLVYRLAMGANPGKYIISDTSLTGSSKKVWKRFYQLSETGVYDRIWLGALSSELLKSRTVIKPDYSGIEEKYSEDESEKIIFNSIDTWKDISSWLDETPSGSGNVEEEFLQRLTKTAIKPEDVGWLWGYKLKDRLAGVDRLLKSADEFIEDISKELEVTGLYQDPESYIKTVLVSAGGRLFDLKYEE